MLFNFSVIHFVYFTSYCYLKHIFPLFHNLALLLEDKEVHRKWDKVSQIKKYSYLAEYVAVNTEHISIVFKSLKIVASVQVILACEHTII